MRLVARASGEPFDPQAGRAYRTCATALAIILLLPAWQVPVAHAEEYGRAELDEWQHRLSDAAKRNDAAEQVLCLTTIEHHWPWAFATLPRATVEHALSDAEDAALGAARVELLQILYERRWKRADGTEPSGWWRDLSLALLERNQADEAFAVAAHITDPYEVVAIRADSRYQRIAKSALVEHDVRKATETRLDWWRAAAAREPRNLSRVVGVAWLLLVLHRYDDSLKFADAAQQRLSDPNAYDDQARQALWLADVKASALLALGRHDEAIAARRETCSGSSPDPVSHCLNLARTLADLNRPRDALEAIPDLKSASKRAHAIAALVRVMAASELGDAAAQQSALADLHAQTAYRNIILTGLIAAGRQEEAAQALVTRLSDPDLQCDALMLLQDYQDPPAPEQVQKWRAQLKQLRARPEVRQAINSHGRIDAYSLPGVIFGLTF